MNRRFTMTAAVAAGLLLFTAQMAMAQPGRDAGRGGFGRLFNNPVFLLRNPKVQEELELVEDQVQELQNLQEEVMGKVRDTFRGMRDADQDARAARMEEIKTYFEDLQKQVDGILLPHQQKRLKQLFFQRQTARGNNGLLSGPLAEQLNLSEEQLEKMREAAEKAQQELREKMAKLQQEAREKILSFLTSEQRAKFDELMGDPFDFGDDRGRGDRGRGGERGRLRQRGSGF